MNYFTLLFNRVYALLVKVKNQRPFTGAVFLVSLLVGVGIETGALLIYAFKPVSLRTSVWSGLAILLLITGILYWYADKRRYQISQVEINSKVLKGVYVASLFLVVNLSFVVLANVNRGKISNETSNDSKGPLKPSLEGRIREWIKGL